MGIGFFIEEIIMDLLYSIQKDVLSSFENLRIIGKDNVYYQQFKQVLDENNIPYETDIEKLWFHSHDMKEYNIKTQFNTGDIVLIPYIREIDNLDIDMTENNITTKLVINKFVLDQFPLYGIIGSVGSENTSLIVSSLYGDIHTTLPKKCCFVKL